MILRPGSGKLSRSGLDGNRVTRWYRKRSIRPAVPIVLHHWIISSVRASTSGGSISGIGPWPTPPLRSRAGPLTRAQRPCERQAVEAVLAPAFDPKNPDG